ncbi:hypothetical protein [Hoylesella timonensis]|uniref:Uncharacterized protein n=1 Tax=Hoylesella timonensis TaxID=386414 RepID=A0A2N6Q8F5_9BACT|nr:hypothetical protein [Hoylesella timonensis]PMC11279.1 hypothetical protein CJ232_00570 [Hoylesella timonensis]
MNLVKTHNMLMSVDLLSMFNLLLKQKDIIVFAASDFLLINESFGYYLYHALCDNNFNEMGV